jgi:hypothetical protein
MGSPGRTSVIVPGALAVAALGLLMGAASVRQHFQGAAVEDVARFLGSVLVAPFLFLMPGWPAPATPGPVAVPPFALALLALALVPTHPLFQRPWAAAVTVAGLGLWLLCALMVAGSPA